MQTKILFLLHILISNFVFCQSDTGFLYIVDISDHSDDLFHVECYTPKLNRNDSIYHFVAFAPGVHQPLNYGRFVKEFYAFDKDGNKIFSEKIGTNDWRIENPERVFNIRYVTEDSFDAEVEGNKIYPMSGTGIEEDYVIINNFGIFGYFDNFLTAPIQIDLKYNKEWKIGTALNKNGKGYYAAESYHHLIDSPIYIGKLDYASRKIGDIEVEVFSYAKSEEITADTILTMSNDMLNASYDFVTFAPVERYSFLMYFNDMEFMERNKAEGGGALEHSNSSTYALGDFPDLLPHVIDAMSHEFMHILTPLNLHSEILENFDYSQPCTTDVHIWLYEGVTEWTNMTMRFRAGLLSLDEYLSIISDKIENTEYYRDDYSLVRISQEWSSEEGNIQYGNVYQLGALTATLLDIRLLELSQGKKGLREVYLELIKKYGKNKSFINETFFDEFVRMTYPEIADFINRYIKNREVLPYQDYFDKLGIKYTYSRPSNNKTPLFGLGFGSREDGSIVVSSFSKNHKHFGLELGDEILEIFNYEVNNASLDKIIEIKNNMNAGDKYRIKVKRGDKFLTFEGELNPRIDYHIFEIKPDAKENQIKLRNIWSKNLPIDLNSL